jgi:hypothetical protein
MQLLTYAIGTMPLTADSQASVQVGREDHGISAESVPRAERLVYARTAR